MSLRAGMLSMMGLLALATAQAQGQTVTLPDRGSALQFVQSLYPRQSCYPIDSYDRRFPRPRPDQIFTEGLIDLNRRAASYANPNEAGGSGLTLSLRQDCGEPRPRIVLSSSPSASRAYVLATFDPQGGDRRESVVYALEMVGGAWRVGDVTRMVVSGRTIVRNDSLMASFMHDIDVGMRLRGSPQPMR